jgi:hypothetical protein
VSTLQAIVAVLSLAQTSIVAGALEQDPRLARQPTLSPPECKAPRSYHLEYWHVRSLAFVVVLKSATVFPAGVARELARKHRFAIHGVIVPSGSNGALLTVRWLEPTQVAALRCEDAVDYIEFVQPVELL